MKRILILGGRGQLGWELTRTCSTLGEVTSLDLETLDLSQKKSIENFFELQNKKASPFDVIINASAYTAVDKAEALLGTSPLDPCYLVNALAPGLLAAEAKKQKALFIHYSTDYVFDGSKEESYREEDQRNPINYYGYTKAEGEKRVLEECDQALIFRLSWVYAARGSNFVKTILRLAQEKEELKIVADQVGSPTWARMVAQSTSQILVKYFNNSNKEQLFNQPHLNEGLLKQGQIYHLVAKDQVSWFEFTNAILDYAIKLRPDLTFKVKKILPISTQEYPTPAKRPLNSCLNSEAIVNDWGLDLNSWEEYMKLCLEEILAN